VIIPVSITASGKEYAVTSIRPGAFHLNKSVTSVKFATGSQVASFAELAFQNSEIALLEIPSSVAWLDQATFRHTPKLVRIDVKGGDACTLGGGVLYSRIIPDFFLFLGIVQVRLPFQPLSKPSDHMPSTVAH
jgi:hypothetical protein